MTVLDGGTAFLPNHVAELALRRYRAGEFSSARVAEIDGHLAGCSVCRSKLRLLVEEQRQFESEISFERFAGGVERAQRVPRAHPRRSWTFGILGGLAIAAAALFFVRVSSKPYHGIKGAMVEATARVAAAKNVSAQRSVPPGSREVLEPGDRVRIGYKIVDARRYLSVVSVDDDGQVSLLYPASGSALAIEPTRETVYLPDSIEFSGSGRERVFLFLSRTSFNVEAAARAVRTSQEAAKGDLESLPSPAFSGGQDVFSWLFSKP